MLKQHSNIGALILVALSACSLDTKLGDLIPEAHAQVLGHHKMVKCVIDTDCVAINQDCCGEESGIVVAHRNEARGLAKKKSVICAKEHAKARAEGRSLCQYQTTFSAFRYPKVGCDEDGVCVIKVADAEADKTACSLDAQCEIFDPDCCDNGDNVVAINVRFGKAMLRKKSMECAHKLQAEPRMCHTTRSFTYNRKHALGCVDEKCTLK